jgi:hypothetical protein
MREYDFLGNDKRGVFLTQEELKQMLKQNQMTVLGRIERMIMHEARECERHMRDNEWGDAHKRLINMQGIFERLAKEEEPPKQENKEEA